MPLAPGTRLGPYEILASLGTGGMGEVFRARDTRLGRDVAVKVLPDHLASDPRALARFQSEAKAVAALSHPNILALHDVGETNGVRYAVTELLEGETLRAAVTRGALPLRRALEIAQQLADALAATHGKGIVHRDVKPENVFLTTDGPAKLLDFGLARHVPGVGHGDDTRSPTAPLLTETGAVVGTVAYMSPEQARGLPVDHRSDQFSLGVVLYEMLTGSRPFKGTSVADLLAAVIRDDPAPLRRRTADVPASVATLVNRCLAKEPRERYDSTRDLARDLRAAWPSKSGEDAPRTPRVRRNRLVFLALAVASTVSLGTWVALRLGKPRAGDDAIPSPAIAGTTRVVVSLLENRTGDPSLDLLRRIGSDAIVAALSRIDGLEAVPSGSTTERAALVVSGDFRAEGPRLSLRASVWEHPDRRLVYAVEPTSGPLSAPGEAVELLARRVRDVVALRVVPCPYDLLAEESRPPAFEAYREFVTGLEALGDPEREPAPHFRRALELDPGFLAPRFQLVWVNSRDPWDDVKRESDRLSADASGLTKIQRRRLDVQKAILAGRPEERLVARRELVRLAPQNPADAIDLAAAALACNRPHEALAVLDRPLRWGSLVSGSIFQGWRYFQYQAVALHLLGEHPQELEAVRRGREVYPDVLGLARFEVGSLAAMGRLDEVDRVVTECERKSSRSLDPGAIMINVASELRAHGRRAESIVYANRALGWYRSRKGVPEPKRLDRDAMCFFWAERWKEARDSYARLAAAEPAQPFYEGMLAVLSAACGDQKEAARLSEKLHGVTRPWSFGRDTYARACVTAMSGDREAAVDLLRKSLAEGYGVPNVYWPFIWHAELELQALLGYPPFEALLKPNG